MPVLLADKAMNKHFKAFAGKEIQKAEDMTSDGKQEYDHQQGTAVCLGGKTGGHGKDRTVDCRRPDCQPEIVCREQTDHRMRSSNFRL
jgi:hypothetical protein